MRLSVPARAGLLFLGAAIAAACGARSDLGGTPEGHGGASTTSATTTSSVTTTTTTTSSVTSSTVSTTSSGPPPCQSDSECDDGVGCTIDTCTPSGCVNTPDSSVCDDGVFCTIDFCDPKLDCQSQFSNSVCDDGIGCTNDSCDPMTDSCQNEPCDSLCDDQVFCNGVERCDSVLGCVHGPPACQLGLPCSNDKCQEQSQSCTHIGSSMCAPPLRLLITDASGKLLSVSPYGGPPTTIAQPMGGTHYDIAILNGRWFAIDPTMRLLELQPMSNAIKKAFMVPNANSLGAGPDGMLYAASTIVYRLNPDTGTATSIGSLPPGYQSSGDIAFLGNRMFISVDGPCGGALIEFDPGTGSSTVRGGDGLGCVYGLAVSSDTMFVVDCSGKIGTYNPDTGVVTVLSTPNLTVYGADILP